MVRRPEEPQVVVTLQVDPAVFAWFDAQEDGWERRIRAALRIYVEAHKTTASPCCLTSLKVRRQVKDTA